MSKIDDILSVVGKYRPNKNGFLVCCPAHEDSNPSLAVREIQYGNGKSRILVKCFAGCSSRAVKEAFRSKFNIGIETSDDFVYCPNTSEFSPLYVSKPDSHWVYVNEEGAILCINCRYDGTDGKKRFLPLTPWKNKNGEMEWREEAPPEPRPLYGLDRLAAEPQKPVLIVEGEKAADAARLLADCAKYVPVTWLGGAASIEKTDFEPLRGRNVTIWPDNDAPGKKAAEKLSDLLGAAGVRTLSVVQPPACLPEKWDLADPAPLDLNIAETLSQAKPVVRALADMIINVPALMEMKVPEREVIIDPFIKTSSLSMLYAERGIGKTWLALHMGICIATGEPFLGYDVPKPRNALIVDGEMPLSDLKTRLKALGAENIDGLYLLPSELLHLTDRPLNIQHEPDQQRVLDALHDMKEKGINIEVLIFDNLSSLSAGVDENDNTELESLLRWLVHLRHIGYAVLLVHHAGKSGDQRGASRREDLLDTVMKLTRDPDAPPQDVQGAHFIYSFTKTRGEAPKPYALIVTLMPGPDGTLTFAIENGVTVNKTMEVLKAIEDKKPATSAELAKIMKRSPGAISQHKKKLEDRELIEHTESGPRVTLAGLRVLARTWPDKYGSLLAQADASEEDVIPF